MRRCSLGVLACLIVAGLAGPSHAGPEEGLSKAERRAAKAERKARRALRKQAREFRQLELSGDELRANVDRLTSGLVWHRQLDEALAAGQAAQRPVLWVQALGDLSGLL